MLTTTSRSNLKTILTLAALVTHSVFVISVLLFSTIRGTEPYVMGDTRTSYLVIAENMLDHGAFSREETAPFHWEPYRLPAYPSLIALALKITGEVWPTLLFAPPLAALSTYWLMTLAEQLATSQRVVGITGGLAAIFPNSLGLSGYLLTDAIGAYLVVTAFCATVIVVRSPHRTWAVWIGGICWVAALLMRPILAPAAAFIVLIALTQFTRRDFWRPVIVMIAAAILVPLFLSWQNYRAHEVFTPSLLGAITAREYLFVKVEIDGTANAFADTRSSVRADNQLEALANSEDGTTYYHHLYHLSQDQVTDLIDQKGIVTVGKVYAKEVIRQLFAPWDAAAGLFYEKVLPLPIRLALAGFTALYLLLALGGSIWLWLKQREWLVVVIWLFFGFILATGGISTGVGARLRFPGDLLLLPVVAIALHEFVQVMTLRKAARES